MKTVILFVNIELHSAQKISNNVIFTKKISKGFEQKLASFGLKTPFKDQMGNQMVLEKLS